MKSVYYGKLVGTEIYSDKEIVMFEYVDTKISGILTAAECSTGIPAATLIKEYQLDTVNNQLKVEVASINETFKEFKSEGYILIEKRAVLDNEDISVRYMESRINKYTA